MITARHDAVAFFVSDGRVRDDLEQHLRRIPDLDRALSRLALDRGGPRDLAAIRDGLSAAAALEGVLRDLSLPALLAQARGDLGGHDELGALLERALVAEPPLQLRDGSSIAPGYDPDLDAARRLRDEGSRSSR